MSRELHMIVAEPSVILSGGIMAIVTATTGAVRFTRAHNLGEIEKAMILRPVSMVIISPVLIQNSERQFQGIRKRFPEVPFIGLLHTLHDPSLLAMLNATVSIGDSSEQIGLTIRNILSEGPSLPAPPELLSERETEVLKLLATGKASKEIADQLNISPHTVITHRKNISQKTGIKSVSGLTIYAVVQKIIPLESLVS